MTFKYLVSVHSLNTFLWVEHIFDPENLLTHTAATFRFYVNEIANIVLKKWKKVRVKILTAVLLCFEATVKIQLDTIKVFFDLKI